MSLSVGELFVNLGIQGSDKTIGAISGVKKGLGETASVALETKAAIVAVFYAVERLIGASGKVGTNLTNFGVLTGISTKSLQQYQYAAQQAGIANEEVTSSFKGLQSAMTAVIRGEGAPAGLKILSLALAKMGEGIDFSRIRDTVYMMEKLAKVSQGGMGADMKRWAIGTLGLTEGVIAAMEAGKFNPKMLASAPTYSSAQIAALNQANVGWMNLGTHIERAFGAFNAKHGGAIVKDLTLVTDQVIKFVDSFQRLSESIQVLQRIGAIFEGIGNTLKLVNELFDKFNGKDTKGGLLSGEALPGMTDSPLGKFFKGFFEQSHGPLAPDNLNFNPNNPNFYTAPDVSKFPVAIPVPPPVKVEVHQHPGAKDQLKVKHSSNSVDKQSNYALRQNPTVLQGA